MWVKRRYVPVPDCPRLGLLQRLRNWLWNSRPDADVQRLRSEVAGLQDLNAQLIVENAALRESLRGKGGR